MDRTPHKEQQRLEEEKKVHKLLKSETVLQDHSNVFIDYAYIADGKFVRSPITGSVGEWKKRFKIKEVRRCEIFSHRNAKLGEEVR